MNIVFPLISFPYASHILMPAGIGKVNFANSVIEYFVLLAALGINGYATREAAKIRDDKKKLSAFARNILAITLFSTIVSYLALIISLFFVPKFIEYRILIIICSTKILFSNVGMEWLYRAEEEFGYITLRQTLFQIVSLILLFTFVREKDDYLFYAGIGVFANVGANLFNLIHSRKFINLFEKARFSVRKHLKPVIVFFGITCAGKINSALDAVMLGFILNDTAVGLYSAALKINLMVTELIRSAVSSFTSRSSYYIAQGQEDKYKDIINQVCNVTFFFSIPASAGLFFLCEPIIVLFSGEKYLPAVPSMKILALSVVGNCAYSFINNLIVIPQRMERYTLIAQISAACTNIFLNFILISRLEVFGAALATLAVDCILPLVVLIPSWKFVKSLENAKNILKSILGTLLMLLFLYFYCSKIESNLIKILVSAISGSFCYASTTLLVRHPIALFIFDKIRNKI